MTGRRPTAILLAGDSLNLGGSEGQFVEVACGLSRARWQVRAALLRAEGPLRARLDAAGIEATSWGPGSFKSPSLARAVVRLARYLRSTGIRLTHSFDFYSNILSILAARLARVPVIIASQRDIGDLRPRSQQAIHRFVLRLAAYVLVNSQAVADRVEASGRARRQQVVVIPNGVDPVRFAPADRRSGPPNGVVVGTVANLRPEKGLRELVHCAAVVRERVPQARFVIWGGGPLRADLETLVARLDLCGTVEFRGPTAHPEAALRECDVYVLPSLSEACPNVLLEAMATRLPVVASAVGGVPELVQHGATGLLVPPRDPAALGEAVVRIVEDRALAARLAEAGRRRIEADFEVTRMIGRVESLYDRALEGSGG
jgi:L-malate glycosyltransferase